MDMSAGFAAATRAEAPDAAVVCDCVDFSDSDVESDGSLVA
jgi:hypothetical protein